MRPVCAAATVALLVVGCVNRPEALVPAGTPAPSSVTGARSPEPTPVPYLLDPFRRAVVGDDYYLAVAESLEPGSRVLLTPGEGVHWQAISTTLVGGRTYYHYQLVEQHGLYVLRVQDVEVQPGTGALVVVRAASQGPRGLVVRPGLERDGVLVASSSLAGRLRGVLGESLGGLVSPYDQNRIRPLYVLASDHDSDVALVWLSRSSDLEPTSFGPYVFGLRAGCGVMTLSGEPDVSGLRPEAATVASLRAWFWQDPAQAPHVHPVGFQPNPPTWLPRMEVRGPGYFVVPKAAYPASGHDLTFTRLGEFGLAFSANDTVLSSADRMRLGPGSKVGRVVVLDGRGFSLAGVTGTIQIQEGASPSFMPPPLATVPAGDLGGLGAEPARGETGSATLMGAALKALSFPFVLDTSGRYSVNAELLTQGRLTAQGMIVMGDTGQPPVSTYQFENTGTLTLDGLDRTSAPREQRREYYNKYLALVSFHAPEGVLASGLPFDWPASLASASLLVAGDTAAQERVDLVPVGSEP